MNRDDVPGRRVVTRVLVGSVVLMVAYWVLWFTARGSVASNDRAAYREFENAFPLADAWITWCLLAGWWTLRHRRPVAVLWLLLGGGAGLYLAGMDVLYDLEQGIWWRSGDGGVIELGINVATLAVSVGLATWTWRHRTVLLAPASPGPARALVAQDPQGVAETPPERLLHPHQGLE